MNKLHFKVIAADMDGTFMRDDQTSITKDLIAFWTKFMRMTLTSSSPVAGHTPD